MVFKKLREWTAKAVDCFGGGSSSMVSRTTSFDLACTVDPSSEPREIPRPNRYPPLQMPNCETRRWCWEDRDCGRCSCHNCVELSSSVSECPICLGRLSGIATCAHCANITCIDCAAKLNACPYCRHAPPPARNTAVERILANLHIYTPRWNSEKKDEPYNGQGCIHRRCPVKRSCIWRGDSSSVVEHLTEAHSVTVLGGSGITLEIAGFRAKAAQSNNKERRYVVALACHDSLFLVKIALKERTLSAIFVELCGGRQERPTSSCDRYGVWLQVSSPFRTMKGIMPVATRPDKYRELLISCETLLSPWRRSSTDTVTIDITIRPLS